ncbi:hypothetical protein QWZ08_14015 [Ferruginibacter paludis]|uniref:hypothetical protein n=1 Tax=Ferruginibacter paludis TaxID=1310417 RepID=UPI0025B415BC|nr:hypothetical protein [Ferruginibacter paludis]MDN3656757.1 hypothetical protein [Ferruginibacter paludis]
MLQFVLELKARNEALFYFSAICFALAVLFYLLGIFSQTQVAGVNAWIKPFKFAVSIGIYCSTMAWYCFYLPSFNILLFNRANIALFTFELLYITIQASRGQESHFNTTTAFYRILFACMAVAAIAITCYTAYAGIKFCQSDLPNLAPHYLWAIRLSIFIFIIFSFEGLAMGGRQTHTIGTQPQHTFLPIFKWNMKEGDLRVAHFIGMHALQVIPLLSFYLLKATRAVFTLSGVYLVVATAVLIQALQAKPFIKTKQIQNEIDR